MGFGSNWVASNQNRVCTETVLTIIIFQGVLYDWYFQQRDLDDIPEPRQQLLLRPRRKIVQVFVNRFLFASAIAIVVSLATLSILLRELCAQDYFFCQLCGVPFINNRIVIIM